MLRITWFAAVVLLLPGVAFGQDAGTYFNERCARRLSSAIMGQGASAALISSSNPQAQVDAMLAPSPVLADGGMDVSPFQEKFSRYVNAQFNPEPGNETAEDASYWMVRYVLQRGLQWKDVFVGGYKIIPGENPDDPSTVVVDTAGLGYFRNRQWMVRYAGNEAAGYRLVGAYRILNNVLGVRLTAAQNTDGVDAATRQSNSACSGCHFDPVFGLDLVARVLSKRKGIGSSMTFLAPTDGPQVLLGGQTISNDAQLLNAMVASTDFKFRACRIAFEYLYGRSEFKCEGAVFDRCVAAFSASGKITDAIATVAKDPSFCQ